VAYAQVTRSALATEILEALGTGASTYWATSEVNRTINEALLYWGALTSYWRERGTFNTVANTAFYDLNTQFPTLRPRTITMGEIAREIQYHLLEPANGVAGTGMTVQFTVGQITSAIERARNQFVIDALLPLTDGSFNVLPATDGRTTLNDSIVGIQRVAWLDGSGIYTPLRREDGAAADATNYLWPMTPKTPFAYSIAETRPVELQFLPPPVDAGTMRLLYVKSVNLVTAEATSLELPNEFASGVKYGALHELLSTNNEGYDPMRSQYALERYRQVVDAARSYQSAIRVQLERKPLAFDTIWNMDAARPTWMNKTGTPNFAGLAYDFLGLSHVPSGVFGMTCDVVRAAPLPTADADFIQMGREEIPYLVNYCRHVLSFKLGGSDFESTFKLYDNFIKGAMQRNINLVARSRYLKALFGKAQKQIEQEVPA